MNEHDDLQIREGDYINEDELALWKQAEVSMRKDGDQIIRVSQILFDGDLDRALEFADINSEWVDDNNTLVDIARKKKVDKQ